MNKIKYAWQTSLLVEHFNDESTLGNWKRFLDWKSVGRDQQPATSSSCVDWLNDKLHTKRQQVHISMFRNLLQLTNSVAIGF